MRYTRGMANQTSFPLLRDGTLSKGWVLLFSIALLLTSCASGTATITRSANNTTVLTTRSDAHADALVPHLPPDDKEGLTHIAGIKQANADIRVEQDKTRVAVTTVRDITPWWAEVLVKLCWAAIILAVVFLVIRFWPVISLFLAGFQWFSFLIPRPTRSQVKLDYEAYEAATPEQQASMSPGITHARATDPMYDAAWKSMASTPPKV